ncbi:hypothetical protein WJX81_000785 [Elliptochloris bilobata]|uniref:Translation initiation factor eIF2B subunit alpha n=1 Tax=Elliptochloris bilobata TaxID=381761 RepID=A0AAW1S382_9CHLO
MQKRSISQYLDEESAGPVHRAHVGPGAGAPAAHAAPVASRVRFAEHDGPAFDSGGASYHLAGAPDQVSTDFHNALARSPEMAVAVAAIKALTNVIQRSKAQTMMGLEKELKEAAASLERCNETAISLKAGCQLFLRYTTRTSALDAEDFEAAKRRIIKRGTYFAETSVRARAKIADLGAPFIRPGARVLTHGHSRVVLALLRRAVAQGIQFSVVVTEGRPDETGLAMARDLHELGVPVIAILDSAVAFALERLRVDLVLLGAEGVVENGGVINKLGTYQIALAAAAHNTPFYVAAESYKFARLYPLSQKPSRDYTPPKYISLLFTDLGVLTPAAVSDELIQLYS